MTPSEIFALLKQTFGDAVAFTEAKQAPAPKPTPPPAPPKPAVPAAGAAAAKPAVPAAPKPATPPAPGAEAKPAAAPKPAESPKVDAPPAADKPQAMAAKPEDAAKPAEAPKPHAPPPAAAADKPAAPAPAATDPAAPKPAAPPAAPKPAAPAAAGAPAKPAVPGAPAAAAKPAAAGAMVSIGDPFIKVTPPEKLPDVMAFLRDDPRLQFDLLHDLAGLDQKECVEVVYHLNSLPKKHWIVIKVGVPRANGVAPTVAHLWKTAIWHERECFDLFGVKFAGNPDLRRILLPDDWEGHPLLKDYKVQEFYRGMPVPYHAEHWVGEGTLVTKKEDVSAADLEQWYQMGLKPAATSGQGTVAIAPAPAAPAAAAPKPAAPAPAAAASPEIKTESKPGEAPKPTGPA